MATTVLAISKIPKYERIQHLASRFPNFDPDSVSAVLTLSTVSEQMMRATQAHLAQFGISQGRYLILSVLLAQHPKSMIHSELAEEFGVTKGNITGLIDGLEKDGYVKREKKDGDRRASAIVLTSKGKKLIEEVLPDSLKHFGNFMCKLSSTEQKMLVSLLLKVKAGLVP